MKIPLFASDWPHIFSETAEFIGKSWPTGNLSPDDARTVTAVLFGYDSVDDIEGQLVQALDDRSITVDAMVESMTLLALLRFQIDPSCYATLLRKLAWKKLGVWAYTNDAKVERLCKEARKQNRFVLIDEFHSFINYSSPKSLQVLIDEKLVPNFEYAVDVGEVIYRRSLMESLLNTLNPSEEQLKEAGFIGTASDFIREYLVPLAWVPVANALVVESPAGNLKWNSPYMIEIKKAPGSRYVMYHAGFHGYFPGIFDAKDLKIALYNLYTGKMVDEKGIDNVEANAAVNYLAGGVRFFTDNQQILIRTQPLNNYSEFLVHPWINRWIIPCMKDFDATIPKNILGEGLEYCHELIQRWLMSDGQRSLALVSSVEERKLAEAIQPLFHGHRYNFKGLLSQGEFRVEIEEGMSDDYIYELRKELRIEIKELQKCGALLRSFHPEIAKYFDDVALGHAYRDFCGRGYFSGCNERSIEFVRHLVAERLAASTGINTKHNAVVGGAILADLCEGKLRLDRALEAWVTSCELFSVFDTQSSILRNMREYSSYLANRDPGFLSHGEMAKIAIPFHFGSEGNVRRGRKYALAKS